MNTETKSAFQTWRNGGGLEMGPFYTGKDAVECERRQADRGNVATLHAFDSVEEGELEFETIALQIEAEEAALYANQQELPY